MKHDVSKFIRDFGAIKTFHDQMQSTNHNNIVQKALELDKKKHL
jgi:hypothetical protein